MNLEKYALTNDLTPADVVDIIKPEFPKFTKSQYSMCKNPNYGVVLAPKAVRVLNKAHPQKKETRTRGNRITVWMNDYLYSLLLSKCESESRTMQDVAEMAIYSYLKPEARRIESHELNLKPDKELLMKVYNLKNELCLKCGNYQLAHHGACDNCSWKQ